MVAIVTKFIVLIGSVVAFLPPAITPLVEFESPADLEIVSGKSPKSEAFPVVDIVT